MITITIITINMITTSIRLKSLKSYLPFISSSNWYLNIQLILSVRQWRSIEILGQDLKVELSRRHLGILWHRSHHDGIRRGIRWVVGRGKLCAVRCFQSPDMLFHSVFSCVGCSTFTSKRFRKFYRLYVVFVDPGTMTS